MRRLLGAVFALSVLLVMTLAPSMGQGPPSSPLIAIKAGRLIDPETGTATTGQVILVCLVSSRHEVFAAATSGNQGLSRYG
jgi:hypothetical protein